MTRSRAPLPQRPRARHLPAAASLLVLAVTVTVALAYFSAGGSGTATATVGALTPAANVTAQQSGADVTIGWDAAALSSGGAVDGYRVVRSDSTPVCGTPVLVTSRSCTDLAPPSGTYTYSVVAVYRSFTATATSPSVTVTAAPTVSSHPSDPSADTAPSFGFSGGGSDPQCQLDLGAYASCSSPRSYSGLSDGAHVFRVRAGASGPSSSFSWTLDASAPTISAKPGNPSSDASPSFTFTHTQATFTFRCSLDGASFSACASPRAYPALGDGSHTFRVQALGADGVPTSTAAYTWTLDTASPSAAFSFTPAGGLVWANNSSGTIGRANVDGSNVNQSFLGGAPSTLGVAAGGGYVFWSNTTGSASGKIGRANVDGTGAVPGFIPAAYVWSVAADGAHVYWTDTGHNWIGRANLDGSGVQANFISAGVSGPVSIAVDGGHVYWANISNNTIGRANLDGSSPVGNFMTLASGVQGIAVDAAHVYFTAGNAIGRANLDGTGANPTFVNPANSASSIAVDDGHIYWGSGNSIGRANLDGTGPSGSFISGGSSVRAVALLPSSTNALLSGTTLYFNGTNPGSGTLTATVADPGSGPASASFPDIQTSGWTHAAQTVTTPTGGPYVSSPFAWTAGPATPSGYTVTARDAAGNATTTPITFVNDTSAPTGGSVSVNGTGASASGTTSTSPSASFAIGSRVDYSETRSASQAGLRSTALTVQSATLTNGVCGAAGSGGPFTAPVTITGTTQPSGIATGFCYVYRLSGTDSVDNTASKTTTVQVPFVTQSLALASGSTASSLHGATLYFRGSVDGSFQLVDTVTTSSGVPASATYPAIAATGWTHPAETVSAPSGGPYTSSTFAWTANPATPAGYSVTATDTAAHSAPQPVTFVDDSAAPTGGAVRVNGTDASAAGTSSISAGPSFAIDSRTDATEARSASQTGLESSTLTVQSASYDGTTCGDPGSAGPFAEPETVTGTTQPSGFVAGRCYRYALTGTDEVGNAQELSTTVMVAPAAPVTAVVQAPGDATTGSNPRQLAFSPDGHSIAVANYGSNTISRFSIDPVTGVLTPQQTIYSGGSQPSSLDYTADGRLLAVANSASNALTIFFVNPSTGALSLGSNSGVAAGPSAVSFSPEGSLLALSNTTDKSIWMMRFDESSATPTQFTVTSTNRVSPSIRFSPDGTHIATADVDTNTMSVFSVDGATANLTEAGQAEGNSTESYPLGAAFSPDGSLLATGNQLSDSISVFRLGEVGDLSPVLQDDAATGAAPTDVAFSPDGTLLASANQNGNSVSLFGVGRGGALTSRANASTGAGASAVAFSPDGHLLVTANFHGNSLSVFTVAG